jgi:hypothetical protein
MKLVLVDDMMSQTKMHNEETKFPAVSLLESKSQWPSGLRHECPIEC